MEFNYLFTISFLGTRYHGSQIQKNALTVQEIVQNSLYQVLKEKTDVKFCSRTDSGVHAFRFCISFKSGIKLNQRPFISHMNHLLPKDIRAISLKEVPNDFHARYSCKGKKYIYYFYNSEVMSPFWEGRAYQVPNTICMEKMREASTLFLGYHDFSSFCSVKSDIEDKRRTVYAINVDNPFQDIYTVSISADGFLYNMARIIAGALLQYSRGKITLQEIEEYLNGKSRDNLLLTLPAYGLYLKEVYY